MQSALPPTDVIIALTSSRTPLIPTSIDTETTTSSVGAFKPDMVAFPPELLHQRQLLIDDLAGTRHEASDLI
jgi:1-piperideine-2-carboxylate/1-pyrroline-2-carboxylate reductase [NAD(P)H]